nr:uncharacterized protein LOC128686259 [Cherax quadricarinatus]
MENGDGKLCWKPKEYYHPSPGLQYGIVLLNEAVNKTNVHYVSFLWQHEDSQVECVIAVGLHLKILHLQLQVPEMSSLQYHRSVMKPSSMKYSFSVTLRIEHVTVIAGLRTERFDHVIANIATLYKVEMLISVPVVIVCGGSIYWLLAAGDHSIQVAEDIIFNPQCSWCGLVPVGQPSTVTTTGLKWNLNNQVLAFGHVVSTSNTFDPICYGVVTVTTSQPLLWTMGWDIEHAPTLQEIEDHTSSRFPSKGTSEVNCLGCPTSTHGN